jgi:DNA-directed RNA polymerase subunit RPC12/RpoP
MKQRSRQSSDIKEVRQMKYICSQCGCEIYFLETEGEGENRNFVCQECAERIEENTRKALKELHDKGHDFNP